jgi:DNA-directed RNA polymerase specialized sigma24 family protein
MYRTKRLLPSEFTEHLGCTGLDKCPECARGKLSLYNRKLSLAHDWNEPSVAHAASKLRWNDKQIGKFLRCYKDTNMIKCVPDYVLRPDPRSVIDPYLVYYPKSLHISEKEPTPTERKISVNAGLLAYAARLINNEVINDFKRITRTDDMGISLFNKGISPELGNDSVVGYTDSMKEDEHPEMTFLDPSAQSQFSIFENHRDLKSISDSCEFDNETTDILNKIELGGMSVTDYSDLTGVAISKIHRIRTHIMKELRAKASSIKETFDQMARKIADKYNVEVSDIFGDIKFGDCVKARTEFILGMSVAGLDAKQISKLYSFTEAQVESALFRASVRPPAIEQQAVGF